MKLGKRMMSLVLALVMMFGLVVSANAADTRTPITAYLDYNITIQYNGKAQALSDVNGDQVYPVSYNGTTYVPIRSIGYLLGLSVDWDGATQTVLLGKSTTSDATVAETATVTYTVTFENPTAESIRRSMKRFGCTDHAIKAAVAEFEAHGPNGENGTFIHDVVVNKKDTFKTTEGAIVLGEGHLACDHAEVDYSMADKGYVQVKLTKPMTEVVYCSIDGANMLNGGPSFYLTFTANIKTPDTKGLDMQRLGAGHDEDGWIRLDPTWGGTSGGRADAAIDKDRKSDYAYE